MPPEQPFNFGASFEKPAEGTVNNPFFNRAGQTLFTRGEFVSPNFKKGVMGWMVDEFGNAEFNNGIFRGTFNIGGTTITIDNTEDIQENLDIIEAAGGGTLYLQNGTYTLTADISIPAGTVLQGVSRDGVIIDCNTAFKVNIVGSNAYTGGTIAINDGDTTVVGSSTTFTSAMVGRYIMLSGLWYEIITFTDATHVEISPAYSGTNLSGYGTVIATVNFAATLAKVTVINGTVGVKVQYAQEYFLDDIIVDSCTTGVDIDDVVFGRHLMSAVNCGVGFNANNMWGWKIDFSEFSNNSGTAGVVMSNSGSGTYFDSAGYDNTGDGINLTSCSNIAFISTALGGNGGQGIELVSGCNDIQMIAFTSDGNTSDGIKLTATSDRNTIVASSIINNGGYGVNIAASSCDNNQVVAPAFSGNSSGAVNDSGTATSVIVNNHGCKAYRTSSDQVIADATTTVIQFNAESWDLDGEYDTSTYKYTANISGYYMLTAAVQILSVTPPANVILQLTVNGTSVSQLNTKGYDPGISILNIQKLNAGDYVQATIYQDDGTSRNLYADAANTYLTVQRLF